MRLVIVAERNWLHLKCHLLPLVILNSQSLGHSRLPLKDAQNYHQTQTLQTFVIRLYAHFFNLRVVSMLEGNFRGCVSWFASILRLLFGELRVKRLFVGTLFLNMFSTSYDNTDWLENTNLLFQQRWSTLSMGKYPVLRLR